MKKILRKIPCEIKYLAGNFLLLFIFFLLFRLVFYLVFIQPVIHFSKDISKAWYLGIKFDLRLALILVLPLWILIVFFRKRFFARSIFRKIILIYFFVIELILLLLYVTDLGFYGYLNRRLDSFVMHFLNLQDADTNMGMVWETYPIIRGLLGMIIVMIILYRSHRALYRRFAIQKARRLANGEVHKRKGLYFALYAIVTFLLMAAGIYGNLAYFPLRWGQAMFTGDDRISSLAINPVLNFVNSFKFSKETADIEATKKYYPYIADYLGVQQPDSSTLNFVRAYPGNSSLPKPNIVFVMLESTGAAVSSMYGNPLQPTPHMKQLADSGLLFENFYVPAHSTARTVFGLITGLPDITTTETASRNKKIIDQRVIMNEFEGYEKYYLLGGNMNWANIRAVFTNNVTGVKLFEESDFKDKRLDVWGISDYNLVQEADKVFKNAYERKKPFVAFLQLADNHRPYSTTSGDGDFKPWTEKDFDPANFKASGFISIDQLNALRYEDYNVGKLIRLAKASGYLKNTIFVFFGDHNCTLNPYDFMPLPEYKMGPWQVHVTSFIYAPQYFKPKRVSTPASLLDLYPTLAHYAGISFKNYTLGVDIFDSARQNHYAFISYWKDHKIFYGLIGANFLYEMSRDRKITHLYDLHADPLINVEERYPDTAKYLNNLIHGFYESTWYLYFNNKKSDKL